MLFLILVSALVGAARGQSCDKEGSAFAPYLEKYIANETLRNSCSASITTTVWNTVLTREQCECYLKFPWEVMISLDCTVADSSWWISESWITCANDPSWVRPNMPYCNNTEIAKTFFEPYIAEPELRNTCTRALANATAGLRADYSPAERALCDCWLRIPFSVVRENDCKGGAPNDGMDYYLISHYWVHCVQWNAPLGSKTIGTPYYTPNAAYAKDFDDDFDVGDRITGFTSSIRRQDTGPMMDRAALDMKSADRVLGKMPSWKVVLSLFGLMAAAILATRCLMKHWKSDIESGDNMPLLA